MIESNYTKAKLEEKNQQAEGNATKRFKFLRLTQRKQPIMDKNPGYSRLMAEAGQIWHTRPAYGTMSPNVADMHASKYIAIVQARANTSAKWKSEVKSILRTQRRSTFA